MGEIGVIAIGRNEGVRLRRCLESVLGTGLTVVYVDSKSSDGSVDLARSLGAEVIELDMSIPFSAARARNEGFARLMQIAPETQFVQMVDGDCQIVANWIEIAKADLLSRKQAGVVCGRRRERYPEASIYNALADLEWNTPIGEANSCGGDALIRVEAFQSVGGYDPTVVAGEEPEMCQRMRGKGWKIYRIDADMTLHDSAMLQFGQWWKRQERSGYGGMDVATRFGQQGLFINLNNSARRWAIGYPLFVLTFLLIASIFLSGWVAGLVLLLAIGVLPLQMLRLAWKRRSTGWQVALGYGFFTMLSKWAFYIGQKQYVRDRAEGKNTRLIDYKAAGGVPPTTTNQSPIKLMKDPNWQADLVRYPKRPFLKEQAIWALWVYRYGRRIDRRPSGFIKSIANKWYWLLFRLVETITGVSLPKGADIGPGFRIWHFGNIFVHNECTIGANCTIRQGVTIGSRTDDGPVPILEDNVDVGAYAQILGPVRIGKGAKIGAMTVVLHDVPPGATAVGIPARIIEKTDSQP